MFCSECGQRATGKFCSHCGHPLAQAEAPANELPAFTGDWTQLTDYETLIRIPAVRDRLAAHAARSQKKMSGEEFLETCDKVLGSLTGGVPLTLIANLTQPISTKLGLKTGKSRQERLAQPPGAVIVAILSSFAERGQKLGEVTQQPTGCTLRAALPSDMWSLKGDVVIDVRTAGPTSTQLEAAITIPGQIYDWGKSTRALNQLFADLTTLSRAA
jgi:hypothetical protein